MNESNCNPEQQVEVKAAGAREAPLERITFRYYKVDDGAEPTESATITTESNTRGEVPVTAKDPPGYIASVTISKFKTTGMSKLGGLPISEKKKAQKPTYGIFTSDIEKKKNVQKGAVQKGAGSISFNHDDDDKDKDAVKRPALPRYSINSAKTAGASTPSVAQGKDRRNDCDEEKGPVAASFPAASGNVSWQAVPRTVPNYNRQYSAPIRKSKVPTPAKRLKNPPPAAAAAANKNKGEEVVIYVESDDDEGNAIHLRRPETMRDANNLASDTDKLKRRNKNRTQQKETPGNTCYIEGFQGFKCDKNPLVIEISDSDDDSSNEVEVVDPPDFVGKDRNRSSEVKVVDPLNSIENDRNHAAKERASKPATSTLEVASHPVAPARGAAKILKMARAKAANEFKVHQPLLPAAQKGQSSKTDNGRISNKSNRVLTNDKPVSGQREIRRGRDNHKKLTATFKGSPAQTHHHGRHKRCPPRRTDKKRQKTLQTTSSARAFDKKQKTESLQKSEELKRQERVALFCKKVDDAKKAVLADFSPVNGFHENTMLSQLAGLQPPSSDMDRKPAARESSAELASTTSESFENVYSSNSQLSAGSLSSEESASNGSKDRSRNFDSNKKGAVARIKTASKKIVEEHFEKLWGEVEERLELTTEAIEQTPAIRGGNKNHETQYGRLLSEPTSKMLNDVMKLDKTKVFLDIGHGIGNTCLQAAYTIGCNTRGIEVDSGRNDWAIQFSKGLKELSLLDGIELFEPGHVDLRLGKLQDVAFRDFLTRADAVFVNNFGGVFSGERGGLDLDQYIAGLFALMKPGAIMVTLHELTGSIGCSNAQTREYRERLRLPVTNSIKSSFFDYRSWVMGSQKDTVSWSKGGSCERQLIGHIYTRTEQETEGEAVRMCNTARCSNAKKCIPFPAVAFTKEGAPIIARCPICNVEDHPWRKRGGPDRFVPG